MNSLRISKLPLLHFRPIQSRELEKLGLRSLFPTDQTRGGSYRKLGMAVHLEPVRANQVLEHVQVLQIGVQGFYLVQTMFNGYKFILG